MQHDNTTIIGLVTSWVGSFIAAIISGSLLSIVPLILSSIASVIVIYKNWLDIKRAKSEERNSNPK